MIDIFTVVYRIQADEARQQINNLNRLIAETNKNLQESAKEGAGLGDLMSGAFKSVGEAVNRVAPGLGGAFEAAGSGANKLLEIMRKIQETRARNNLNNNPPGGNPPQPPGGNPPQPPGGNPPTPPVPQPGPPLPPGGSGGGNFVIAGGVMAAGLAVIAALAAVARSINAAGVQFSRDRYAQIATQARDSGVTQAELMAAQLRGQKMNITNDDMQGSLAGLKGKASEVIMDPTSGMSRAWRRHGIKPGNIRGKIKSADELMFDQVIPTMKKMEALKGTSYATEMGVQMFGLSLAAATKILASSKEQLKQNIVEQNMALAADIKRKNAMQDLTKAELESTQATAKLSAQFATEVTPAAVSAEKAWAKMVNSLSDVGWLGKAGSAWSEFIEGVYNSVTGLIKFIDSPIEATKNQWKEKALANEAWKKDREWQEKTTPGKPDRDWGPEGHQHYNAYLKDRAVREAASEKLKKDAEKALKQEQAVEAAKQEKKDFGPMTKDKLAEQGFNEGQVTFLTQTKKGQEEVAKAMEKFGKDGFGKEQLFETLKQSKIMEQQLKVQWEIRNNTLPSLGMSIEQVLSQMSATIGKAQDLKENPSYKSPTIQQSFAKVTEMALFQRDNPFKMAMSADEISNMSKVKLLPSQAASASLPYRGSDSKAAYPAAVRSDSYAPKVVAPESKPTALPYASMTTPKTSLSDSMTPLLASLAKEKMLNADTAASSAIAAGNESKASRMGNVNSGNTYHLEVKVEGTNASPADISNAVVDKINDNNTQQNRRLIQDFTSNNSH